MIGRQLLAGLVALLCLVAGQPAAAQLRPGDTIGLHVMTQHEADWYNNANAGAYWRSGSSGLQVGAYCNSYSRYGGRAWDDRSPRCRVSAYVGAMVETDPAALIGLGLFAGIATGYPNGITWAGETLMPTVSPSIRLGPARFSLIQRNTVHLSLEYRIP